MADFIIDSTLVTEADRQCDHVRLFEDALLDPPYEEQDFRYELIKQLAYEANQPPTNDTNFTCAHDWILEFCNTTIYNTTTATNTTITTDNATATDDIQAIAHDGAVLQETFTVYGVLFLMFLLLFCIVRKAYPKPYTLRQWVDEFRTPLAVDQFGFFSWIWKVGYFVDDEILEHCGLDALCFLRIMRMGYKVSLVACYNAVWLFPVYSTSEFSQMTGYEVKDDILKLNIAYVPPGSLRLVGTVLAAYILFGYTMYLILKEFQWFVEKRHKFLSAPCPRNYTIFVRNIPLECRDNASLADFFKTSVGNPASLLEANVCVQTPNLRAAVNKREATILKLEHAIAYEEITGIRLTHTASLVAVPPVVGATQVDSINAYARDINELNKDITARIEALEAQATPKQGYPEEEEWQEAWDDDDGHGGIGDETERQVEEKMAEIIQREGMMTDSMRSSLREQVYRSVRSQRQLLLRNSSSRNNEADNDEFGSDEETDEITPDEEAALTTSKTKRLKSGLRHSAVSFAQSATSGAGKLTRGTAKLAASTTAKLAQSATSGTAKLASSGAAAAMNLLLGSDGTPHGAGFVTFTKLSAVHSTLQMVQHDSPFKMEVLEAPAPSDVFWTNVSRTHKDLQLGGLLSLGSTVALCLLWTIPMTFISSLSSVSGLRQQLKFIDDLLNAAPWLEPVFQQLAPYLVVVVNSALPEILLFLSQFEGPIAAAQAEASTFGKLAAFMVIQTFFVSALSGGVFEEIANILQHPWAIIDLLAYSLPAQSTYFIQIVFVGTVIPLGLELLRIIPLIKAAVRLCVGPRLTEKQRRKKCWWFIRPLADPLEMEMADYLAQAVLFFMVQLVYAVIAPITSFVVCFCFVAMGVAFRHQFIYVYPVAWDSGGKMWPQFIGILVVCMLIAEVTIFGLLAIKRSALAVPLMLPLIIITALFRYYISQEHYRAAEYLSARACNEADKRRKGDQFDLSFLKDAFVQPELRDKVLYPEDLDEEQRKFLFGEEIGDLDEVVYDGTQVDGAHWVGAQSLGGGRYDNPRQSAVSAVSR